ncbi:MAG: RNA 2',3'-cyclic phosphodiesterase [Endomicrobiales bacterium]
MRIFIAVNLPEDVKEQIERVQETLKKTLVDVRWVKKEKFHLTLKFLGEVPEEKAAEVVATLSRASRPRQPFTVALKGLGAFPGLRRPRVVWAGIQEGQSELKAVARDIENELEPLGFQKEKREFSGHLTLGRVRSPQNLSALVKKIASLETVEMGSFSARSIEVMISAPGSGGSTYQCLKSISLL